MENAMIIIYIPGDAFPASCQFDRIQIEGFWPQIHF